MNPQAGFVINNDEKFFWEMYTCFKNGISPREYRKSRASDIKACVEIDAAMEQSNKRYAEIMKAMKGMR